MILPDFKAFVSVLPPLGHILAIDWGRKKSGLAISNVSSEYAFPLGTYSSPLNLNRVFQEYNLIGIVIGLPQYSDGSDSDTTKMIRQFADNLATKTDVPMTFIDETLSSDAAEELYNAAGKANQKKGLDAFAATIILEDALAKIKRIRG